MRNYPNTLKKASGYHIRKTRSCIANCILMKPSRWKDSGRRCADDSCAVHERGSIAAGRRDRPVCSADIAAGEGHIPCVGRGVFRGTAVRDLFHCRSYDVDGMQQAGTGRNKKIYSCCGHTYSRGLWVGAAALWHSGGHYLPIYGISGNFAAGVSGGSMYSKLHEKRENRD